MSRTSYPGYVAGTTPSLLSYEEDLHEVLLLRYPSRDLAKKLCRWPDGDDEWGQLGVWVEKEFDLTIWRGYSLELYFNAYNHDTWGRTWMYLDDVSVEVCLPNGVKRELRPSPDGSFPRLNGEPVRGPGLH
jgi:hypothetical protein